MIDHTDLPRCPLCHGDGWIMDHEDMYAPCPSCEAAHDAIRADLDAELDARAWHEGQMVAREMVAVEADGGDIFPF